MGTGLSRTFITVVLGLFAAGLLASLSIVAAPAAWRGPVVPALAALAGLGIVGLLRRPRQAAGVRPGRPETER
jgi:CHASE2 domain-containing sensor protein